MNSFFVVILLFYPFSFYKSKGVERGEDDEIVTYYKHMGQN